MAGKEYAKDFKESVVAYAKDYEGSIAEVARKFDVPLGTIYSWMSATEKHKEEAFVGTGHLRRKNAEEKEKEKKIRDLQEENAILKKALAIFSKL